MQKCPATTLNPSRDRARYQVAVSLAVGPTLVVETTLERLCSTPSHKEWKLPQGGPTTQPLYQGAKKMPEECMPEESLCTESKSGAQGCGFDPHGRGSFLAVLHIKVSQ